MTLRKAIENAADAVAARKVGPLPVTREGRRPRKKERPTKDVGGQPKMYPKKVSPADRDVLRFALLEIAALCGDGIDTLRGRDEEWAWFETRRTGKGVQPTTVPSRLRAWQHLLGTEPSFTFRPYTVTIDPTYREIRQDGKNRAERVLDVSVIVHDAARAIVLGSENPAERSTTRLERKNSETERAYLTSECAERIAELGLSADAIDTDTLRELHDNLTAAAAKRKKIKVIATAAGFAILVGCFALLQYVLKADTIRIVDVKGGLRRDQAGRPHPTYVVEWTSTLKQPCAAFHILRDGVDVTAKQHMFTMPGKTTCAFEDRSPPLADRTHVREVHYRVGFGNGRSRITSAAARSCDECVNETFSLVAQGVPLAEYEPIAEDDDGKHTIVGLDTPFDLTFVDLSHANAPIDVRQHAEVRTDLQVRCDFGDGTPATVLPVGAIRHVYQRAGLFHARFEPMGVQTQPVQVTVRVAAQGDRIGEQRAKQLVSSVPDNGELLVAMRTGDSADAPKNVIHARRGERVTIFFMVPDDVRTRLMHPRGFVFAWFDHHQGLVFDARTAEMRVIPESWPPNMFLSVSHTWPTAGSRTMLLTATDHNGVELARYLAEVQVH